MTKEMIVGCYWLAGVYFWAISYRLHGKDFTLADLLVTATISAWVWPIVPLCYCWVKAQEVVLLRGKGKSDD